LIKNADRLELEVPSKKEFAIFFFHTIGIYRVHATLCFGIGIFENPKAANIYDNKSFVT